MSLVIPWRYFDFLKVFNLKFSFAHIKTRITLSHSCAEGDEDWRTACMFRRKEIFM